MASNVVSNDLRGAKGLLELLRNSIQTGDRDTLDDILDSILFKEIDFDNAVTLVIGLLEICKDAADPELGKVIYDISDQFYPNNTSVEFVTYLIVNRKTKVDLLHFLIHDVIPFYNIGEIIYQMCMIEDIQSEDLTVAMNKCWQLFEVPTVNDLKRLYEYASTINQMMAREIGIRLRKYNDYAPIPGWIIPLPILPKESSVKIPAEESFKIDLPSTEEMIEFLMSKIDENLKSQFVCQPEDDDEDNDNDRDELDINSVIRNQLMASFNALSLNNKYEMAKEFIETWNMLAVQQDIRLFVTLGPSAPLVGSTYEDLKYDELDYGVTRMFIFNNFDFDPTIEDDDVYPDGTPKNLVDWFVGHCQQCNLRIRRKYHAVRVPMIFGGWQGCFCSWECVRNNVIDNDSGNDVMLKLIDIYEQEINNYKILDRVPDEDYPKYISEVLNKNKELIENNAFVNVDTTTGVDEVDREILDEVIVPEEVNIKTAPIVIHYFYSPKCDVCIRLKPQLYQFVEYSSTVDEAGSYIKNVSIEEINVDENDVSDIGVTQVPTIILTKNEIPVKIFVGANVMRDLSLQIAELK